MEKVGFDCDVCGNEFMGAWTDYYGQQTCVICGAPYQILAPSGADPKDEYPHLCLDPKFFLAFKEHWEKTGKRTRVGGFFIPRDYPGLHEEREELVAWLKIHHPEFLRPEK